MTNQEIAEPRIILEATVGSNLHGLSLMGTDDDDRMGVCLEPPEYVVGLQKFENWVYRTQPEGVRSGPGDLDRTIYSLRKWARLAANGNPTVLLLLFAPPAYCQARTAAGRVLQASSSLFVSKLAGRAFLGYLTQQKERLLGTRGGMRSNRPELIEAHGYDTKYAMHALRLGIQGCELLRTGHLSLPMEGHDQQDVMKVRRGETSFHSALRWMELLETDLVRLLDTSTLPDQPDRAGIDRLLLDLYMARWEGEGLV